MKIKILKEAGPSVKKSKPLGVDQVVTKDFDKEDKWLNRSGYPRHRRFFMVEKRGQKIKNKNTALNQNRWSIDEIVDMMLEYEDNGGDVKDIKMSSSEDLYPYVSAWRYKEIQEALREKEDNRYWYATSHNEKPVQLEIKQIVAKMKENPDKRHLVWKSGWEDWKDALDIPEIKSLAVSTGYKRDVDYKVWHLKTDWPGAHGHDLPNEKHIEPLERVDVVLGEDGEPKLFSAMEIARFINDSRFNEGTKVNLKHRFQVKQQNNLSFREHSTAPVIRKAIDLDHNEQQGQSSGEEGIKQVDGIKVRIGTKQKPCADYSPPNSEKPFGNKQFDPYSHSSYVDGEWECDTEIELRALMAIERFVKENDKIQADVVKTIIDVARDSSPGEPLHPEDDAPYLYRGSSRETLTGHGTPPEAEDILKSIDWSDSINMMKIDGDVWYAFKVDTKFVMKYSVASWTEDPKTAAEFAKGGPSLTPKNARFYQFVYRVPPSAAKEVQGTFIDFKELYQLDANNRAYERGSRLPNFDGIGDYQVFDHETLLLGSEGGSMSVGEIFVNWDYLLKAHPMQELRLGLPEVWKAIKAFHKKTGGDEGHSKEDIEAYWELYVQEQIHSANDEAHFWSDNKPKIEHFIYVIKSSHSDASQRETAYENLRKKYPKSWFHNLQAGLRDIVKNWRTVTNPSRFQHRMQIWNQHPKHAWYQLSHEKLMNPTKMAVAQGAENRIVKLLDQINEYYRFIFGEEIKQLVIGGPKRTNPSEPLVEARKPWYKRWAAVEKRKGMRARLLKKGGNKFVPAKGMKNVKKVSKPKSAPAGVGVLEESDEGLYKDESMALPYISNYLNASWLWKENWPNEMYNQWQRLYNAYYPRSGEKDPLIPEEEISIMLKMLLDKDKVEKYLTDRGQAEIPKLEKILLTLFSK